MNNKLIFEITENLRSLAKSIEAYAEKSNTSHDNTSDLEIPVQSKEEVVTLEQVRAVLAEKSRSGFQPQVKALIQKYGANKLTDLDSSCYANLKKEAEEL